MQESKFEKLYKILMEDMTVAGVLGTTQVSQFSGDTYAPGDNRLPKFIGIGTKKRGKKKKFPFIRRNFPDGL